MGQSSGLVFRGTKAGADSITNGAAARSWVRNLHRVTSVRVVEPAQAVNGLAVQRRAGIVGADFLDSPGLVKAVPLVATQHRPSTSLEVGPFDDGLSGLRVDDQIVNGPMGTQFGNTATQQSAMASAPRSTPNGLPAGK